MRSDLPLLALLLTVACTAGEQDVDRALTGGSPGVAQAFDSGRADVLDLGQPVSGADVAVPDAHPLDAAADAGAGRGPDAEPDAAPDVGSPCPLDGWPLLPDVADGPPVRMMPTEVSHRFWTTCVADRPPPGGRGDGAALPVGPITPEDAALVANRLSTIAGATPCYVDGDGQPYGADALGEPPRLEPECDGFRLPFEAEFARVRGLLPADADAAVLRSYGHFDTDDETPRPVGILDPIGDWYDTIGNQRELVHVDGADGIYAYCGGDIGMSARAIELDVCCPYSGGNGSGDCLIEPNRTAGFRLVRAMEGQSGR